MKNWLKTSLFFFIVTANLNAFDCTMIKGKTYYTSGLGEYQYKFNFKKDGKVIMTTYADEYMYEKGPDKLNIEKFVGNYILSKGFVVLNIKVDKTENTVTFQCSNNESYMGKGSFKALKAVKTIPEDSLFTMILLFPDKSKAIRFYKDKNRK